MNLEKNVREALEYQRLSAAIKHKSMAVKILKMLDEENFHTRYNSLDGTYIYVD